MQRKSKQTVCASQWCAVAPVPRQTLCNRTRWLRCVYRRSFPRFCFAAEDTKKKVKSECLSECLRNPMNVTIESNRGCCLRMSYIVVRSWANRSWRLFRSDAWSSFSTKRKIYVNVESLRREERHDFVVTRLTRKYYSNRFSDNKLLR